MSTENLRQAGHAAVTHFPWQTVAKSIGASAVRPLLTGDPDAAVEHHGARDFVLPSVIAERAAAAEHQGYQRGFAEGDAAAREAVRVRTDAHHAKLVATIDELSALRVGMLRRSEHDVVRLAIAIAERIIRRETRVNRQVLLLMAHAAARKLGDTGVVTVHMHPADLQAATAGRGEAADDGPFRLTADANIPPGGCLVQSSFGTIDAGIDAQIREVGRELLGNEADGDPYVDRKGETGAGH